MVCPVFVWISVLQRAAPRFVLKGFRSRLVHTVFTKHNFINNNRVGQGTVGRRVQYYSFCKHALRALKYWKAFFLHEYVECTGDGRRSPYRRTVCVRVCVCCGHSFKWKGVVGGGGVDSTLSCVKLSSMLFNHAYEIMSHLWSCINVLVFIFHKWIDGTL